MKWRILLTAILGLALAVYLITRVGFGAVYSAAVTVGWRGFAILCLCALVVFLPLGLAWHVLLPASARVRASTLVWARMVRDSAAEVLPLTQLGGIVIGVRAGVIRGIPGPLASASIIVDVTTELLGQIAYLALGIAVLTTRLPRTPLVASVTRASLIGLALAVVAGALFFAVQRYGAAITGRIATSVARGVGPVTAAVSTSLEAIYRSPARVALSAALHFGGWIASGAAAWVAFRLVGATIDLTSVLAIESLVYATRSAAVIVPNAMGVQEAAYALLVPLFGVGAELGLAVSLLKRARDVALGVPILLIWQAAEGRRAVAPGAGKIS